MALNMGKAGLHIRMELFTMDNLSRIKYLDMEFHRVDFKNMRVNGKMVKCMVMVSVHGLIKMDR